MLTIKHPRGVGLGDASPKVLLEREVGPRRPEVGVEHCGLVLDPDLGGKIGIEGIDGQSISQGGVYLELTQKREENEKKKTR